MPVVGFEAGTRNLSHEGSAFSSPVVAASSCSWRSGGGYSPQVQTLLACIPSIRAISDWLPMRSTAAEVFMGPYYGSSHMWEPIIFTYRHPKVVAMKPIGDRIRELREAAGLTQSGLAKACKVDQSVISDVEKKGARFKADTLLLMCEALDTTPEYLMRGATTGGDLARDIAKATALLSKMTPLVRATAIAGLAGIAEQAGPRLASANPPEDKRPIEGVRSGDAQVRASRLRTKHDRNKN